MKNESGCFPRKEAGHDVPIKQLDASLGNDSFHGPGRREKLLEHASVEVLSLDNVMQPQARTPDTTAKF
jgi:hypothetical protein